jgi:hypothetical protein
MFLTLDQSVKVVEICMKKPFIFLYKNYSIYSRENIFFLHQIDTGIFLHNQINYNFKLISETVTY